MSPRNADTPEAPRATELERSLLAKVENLSIDLVLKCQRIEVLEREVRAAATREDSAQLLISSLRGEIETMRGEVARLRIDYVAEKDRREVAEANADDWLIALKVEKKQHAAFRSAMGFEAETTNLNGGVQ